ncbi:major facilitator superfamily domain-containing protein [Aspergillus crustosus]
MASIVKEPAVDVDVLAEKNALALADSDGAAIVKDWSNDEERKLKFKIDTILIPILGLAFFALQIDRGNISAALTSTITEDLNITTNQINVGTQLLSAGIVISEIPSNIILQRVGPQRWLSVQIFAWGLVATFQSFVKSYPAYLVTRFLLGLLEGGFIPGALYYLSTWYKREETSLRVTLFFFGQMFSGATSSLISAGLLTLDGESGMPGWRWIFLIEGVITLGIGIFFVLLVPPKVGDGRPLISGGRWSYFTPRESHIATQRVLLDDPLKNAGHLKITGRDIWNTVRQPRVIQHFFITLVAMSGFQGLGQYTPSMIKSFGFSAVRANALASVPVYCVTNLATAVFVLISITWNVISYACLRVTPATSGRWHRYGVVAVANVSYASMHVLNIGWLSVYCKSPQERSIAMALVVMAANCAGISGSQIFRTDDRPLYHKGLTAICILAGASWILCLALNLQSYFNQKRKSKEEPGRDSAGDV